ncbi:MAG TPA: lactate utilization protein [Acidimicrobiia bacterium]|nr:lactate utilization protein [Acidimicrobiia bacterium]
MEIGEYLAGRPVLAPGAPPGLLVPDLPPADVVDLFLERLRSVDGVGHGPLAGTAATERVVSLFVESDVEEYLGWDYPGLADAHQALAAAGLRRASHWVPESDRTRGVHLQSYLPIAGGLTGADAGLVESGSLVLRSGPGRPRFASLIPSLHVAVLSVDRLVRSLAHYAAQHPAAPEGISNLVVITGPSRTGDIEQELTLGVHGPKHLHVVLVN